MKRTAQILISLCLFVLGSSLTGAATNKGLLIPAAKPTLSVGFGNPTDYAVINPGPLALTLPADGSYFHGTDIVTLEETNPPLDQDGNGPYGGPGDSWSRLTLSSPTPGSTRETPIIYKFDSRIFNASTTVGYSTTGTTPEFLRWDFDQPASRVHFRVEWTLTFIATPFYSITCSGFPVKCKTNTVASGGLVNSAAFNIKGYGEQTIFPAAGASAVIGPGTKTYTGSVAGVATNDHLAISFNSGLSVAGATRGDTRMVLEYRIFADSESLVATTPPVLGVAATAGDSLSLSWPSSADGFVLQQTATLEAPVWKNSDQAPTDNGTTKVVLITLRDAAAYYRLQKP